MGPTAGDRTGFELLACPICRAGLREADTGVRCEARHTFPVINGVPKLLASDEGRPINVSFSAQWEREPERTWGVSLEERVRVLLRQLELSRDDFAGKTVLDAGCGSARLSNAITVFGCTVVGADISDSVFRARDRFRENRALQLVQTDLSQPGLAPGAFDVAFAGGVLHHTPNTKRAFDRVAELVAPGGRLFVWLYHARPGLSYSVRMKGRALVAPMPAIVKRAVAFAATAASTARRPRGDSSWRERYFNNIDFFTPRYRWEHVPEELESWFREAGFIDVRLNDPARDGFGVLGLKAPA